MTGAESGSPLHLQIKKIINASRSKCFDAWTCTDLIKKWFAPGTMTTPEAQVDVRVWGHFRISMQDEGGKKSIAIGQFREIVANHKLVMTWGWEGSDLSDSLLTVEFSDHSGGTEITLTHEPPNPAREPGVREETICILVIKPCVVMPFFLGFSPGQSFVSCERFANPEQVQSHTQGWHGCLENLAAHASKF